MTDSPRLHPQSRSGTVIVVPCYNEERRLRFAAFDTYVQTPGAAHLLFINDGSRDATLPLLCHFQRTHPDACTVASLSENCGKAEAVRQGLLTAIARGAEFVGYWDADLAVPLPEIAAMERVVARDPETEIVIGIRLPLLGRRIRREPLRGTLGRMSAFVTRLLTRLPTRDTQCGAKLFRVTEELQSALAMSFGSRWLFDVELLLRLRRSRGDLAQVAYELPLESWTEQPGSKVSARSYVGALREVIRLAWTAVGPTPQGPAPARSGATAASELQVLSGAGWLPRPLRHSA